MEWIYKRTISFADQKQNQLAMRNAWNITKITVHQNKKMHSYVRFPSSNKHFFFLSFFLANKNEQKILINYL